MITVWVCADGFFVNAEAVVYSFLHKSPGCSKCVTFYAFGTAFTVGLLRCDFSHNAGYRDVSRAVARLYLENFISERKMHYDSPENALYLRWH